MIGGAFFSVGVIAADGELPAASTTQRRLFIAYIAKEERQTIRLVSAAF